MKESKTIVTLAIIRYPRWAVPFAVLSMAIFRLPLWLNKKISFYKLMGCGKNGTFDKTPDWQQWAVLIVPKYDVDVANDGAMPMANPSKPFGNFIDAYWKFFGCTHTRFLLEPIEGHGLWDGKAVFGILPKNTDYEGPIAVLTRATIRLQKLKSFWASVGNVASQMAIAEGFVASYGIGEIPLIKQATFSIWQSKTHMKNFAYKMHQHKEVIKKTHAQKWYSEEMFVRFKVIDKLVL